MRSFVKNASIRARPKSTGGFGFLLAMTNAGAENVFRKDGTVILANWLGTGPPDTSVRGAPNLWLKRRAVRPRTVCRRAIPQRHRSIIAGGGEIPSIRAERQSADAHPSAPERE